MYREWIKATVVGLLSVPFIYLAPIVAAGLLAAWLMLWVYAFIAFMQWWTGH